VKALGKKFDVCEGHLISMTFTPKIGRDIMPTPQGLGGIFAHFFQIQEPRSPIQKLSLVSYIDYTLPPMQS